MGGGSSEEPVPDWEGGLCAALKTALGSFMNHAEQLFNMQIPGQVRDQKICILKELVK